jgi:hypothetical protein
MSISQLPAPGATTLEHPSTAGTQSARLRTRNAVAHSSLIVPLFDTTMPERRHALLQIDRPLLTALAVGSVIAALAPFDLAFDFLTRGSSLARALALPVIGVIGFVAARRVGLGFGAKNLKHPVAVPVLVAAVVAVAVATVDGFLCRSLLSSSYVQIFSAVGLGGRLLYFMSRAFNENLIYRWCVMSTLIWMIGVLWHDADDRPTSGAHWVGIVLAQVINIWINVVATSSGPITSGVLLYDGVRYIVPGVIWGYLYWRHGFVAAEIASVGTHPLLQPALGFLLAR